MALRLERALTGPVGRVRVVHRVLFEGAAPAEALREAMTYRYLVWGRDGGPERLDVVSYLTEVDCGDGSPDAAACALASLQARYFTPGVFRQQSVLDVQGGISNHGLIQVGDLLRLGDPQGLSLPDPVKTMQVASDLNAHVLNMSAEPPNWTTCRLDFAHQRLAGEVGTLTAPFRLAGDSLGTLPADLARLPRLAGYHVVVVGGGTGGVPAAIAAARAGASTAVIEMGSALGGVGTLGQISVYWFGNRAGFTAEVDQGVARLEVEEKFRKGGKAWSPAAKAAWWQRQCQEHGVAIWLHTLVAGVVMRDGRVSGVIVAGPFGYGWLEAGCVVDSTGAADVAAAAGAPVVEIGFEHVAVQGTGLAGVIPRKTYHNSDHNFCDDSDLLDTTAFLVSSRLKFPNAFDMGELVDSRERRQIVGDLTLGPADILGQRRYPDTIGIATSNFDSHGFTIHPLFLIKPPGKKEQLWADVPYRCLLPQGVDGLLVTGLGMSCHRDALPVIRMQADVQNQGYAAGWIAAQSARSGCPLREVDLRAVQQHLVQIGALPERVLHDRDSFPVSDAHLQQAVYEQWDEHLGLSLIFANPDRALPLVREVFNYSHNPVQRLRMAEILACFDQADGREELARVVKENPWDAGWNFRGMGQFGMSMSTMDKWLVCLGRVGDDSAWQWILEKIRTLPPPYDLSHCRALGMACEALWARHPHPKAAPALADLLQIPGIQGHAQTSIQAVQQAITPDPNENTVRNVALRELHLARALYRCGDFQGLGQRILRDYSRDLRGHLARHAHAILAQPAPTSTPDQPD